MDAAVVVIGAGPAGSATAYHLARAGHQVILLEEHDEVGQPVQCAGLVTPRIFDHCPFEIGSLHQNDLHGGEIVTPDGTVLSFRTKAVQAIAIDRAGFDQTWAKAAVEAGAQLRRGTKAVGMTVKPDGVELEIQDQSGRRHLLAQFVVGADGIRGRVAKWAELPPVKEIVSAYEVELHGCKVADEQMIPMFAGKQQAPGFFSWIIPIGNGGTRSGLAVAPGMNEQAARAYYEAMFEDPRSAGVLVGARENYRIIGGIPLGLRKRLVADRVALVGDAAGMAKPTSGGGIYMSLVAAEHLSAVLQRNLARDTLTARELHAYERLVRKTIGKELRKGNLLRHVFTRLRDPDLNKMARLLSKPSIRAQIEGRGDIDYPSRLVFPILLRSPALGLLLLRAALRKKPEATRRT